MSNNRVSRIAALLTGALMAALSLAPCAATAAPDVCDGVVKATAETVICAENDATVADIAVLVGQTVAEGDALLTLRPRKAFAHSDGTVADIEHAEGEYCSGTLIKAASDSLYTIHCSIEDAYEEPANMLVHMGDTVYVKCKKDGSHRAIARVTGIDGSGYTLESLGGELYVGETVYVFSSDEFKRKQRIGVGTVVSSDPIEYAATGHVTRLLVEPGDPIERGQLLYEYLPGGDQATGGDAQLISDTNGIVTSIAAQEGMPLTDGAAVMTIAPTDSLRISVLLTERDAADVAIGDAASILLPWQEYEDAWPGVVESISPLSESAIGDDGAPQTMYEVLIAPAGNEPLRIGMSATVAFEDEE